MPPTHLSPADVARMHGLRSMLPTDVARLREHALASRNRGVLAGLGDIPSEVDAFYLRSSNPSSSEIAEFLKLYSGERRNEAARALLAKGVSQPAVSGALVWLDAASKMKWGTIWGVASTLSMAASAFHGYRRNGSIGWAIWWGFMGATFPVITPVIAVAQGYSKRKGS